jgi:hypothetical protein
VRLFALRTLLTLNPAALPRSCGQSLARLQSMITPILSGPQAEVVIEAIGGVDVMTRLLLIARGIGEVEDHVATLAPTLLASLAAKKIGESFVWDQPIKRVVDRARGTAMIFAEPAKAMAIVGGEIEFQPPNGARTARLHLCHSGMPSVTLAEIDTNPLAMEEAHPDKHGNALNFAGRDADEWTSAIAAALDLVRDGVPSWWSELPLSLERLVPVGYDAEKHLSASFEEAPGLAYITLHPDALTMAEAIVHETQHSKLNLLHWLDPVLVNGQTTWTKSPVRPDLRPLFGVLMAVHAFVPVAAMHAELASMNHPITQTHRFKERRREVLASNAEGLAVLEEKSEATEMGSALLRALRETHDAVVGCQLSVVEESSDQ